MHDEVRARERAIVMGGAHADHLHPRRSARGHASRRVLDHEAIGRLEPEQLGGEQVGVGRGLHARGALSGHDDRRWHEPSRLQAGGGERRRAGGDDRDLEPPRAVGGEQLRGARERADTLHIGHLATLDLTRLRRSIEVRREHLDHLPAGHAVRVRIGRRDAVLGHPASVHAQRCGGGIEQRAVEVGEHSAHGSEVEAGSGHRGAGYRSSTVSTPAAAQELRPPIAARAAAIVGARWFDPLMLGVIGVNALVLALETYESIHDEWHQQLLIVNEVCLGIFIVELLLRLTAEAPKPWRALRSPWTAFDALVIVASFMPGIRENTTLLRLVRILRIARAVRFLPDLRILIVAIGRSIPGVATLAAGTVVLVFIYGMAGWVLFHQQWPEEYGDIGTAMLSMFLLLTLETLPDSLTRGAEITPWAYAYFLSYVIFAAFIVFNLFIGIVISSMEEARAEHVEQDAAKTKDERDDLAIRLGKVSDELAEIQRELKRAAERAG